MDGNTGIEEELHELWIWAKTAGFGTLRPWQTDFFNRFPQVPQFNDWRSVEKGVFTNVLYYRANYLALLMGLGVIGMFWNPLLLITLSIAVSCSLVIMGLRIRALPPPVQRYAVHVKSPTHRMGVAGVFSLLVLGLSGTLTTLLWVLLFGATCIVAHALLRPVKRTAKVHEMLTQLGVSWAPASDMPRPSDEGELLEGGLRASGGASVSAGNLRSREPHVHGMVASGTPTALKGVVGGSQRPAGGTANLPRPGMGDAALHKRATASKAE